MSWPRTYARYMQRPSTYFHPRRHRRRIGPPIRTRSEGHSQEHLQDARGGPDAADDAENFNKAFGKDLHREMTMP